MYSITGFSHLQAKHTLVKLEHLPRNSWVWVIVVLSAVSERKVQWHTFRAAHFRESGGAHRADQKVNPQPDVRVFEEFTGSRPLINRLHMSVLKWSLKPDPLK